jgi:hypothetical protein
MEVAAAGMVQAPEAATVEEAKADRLPARAETAVVASVAEVETEAKAMAPAEASMGNVARAPAALRTQMPGATAHQMV